MVCLDSNQLFSHSNLLSLIQLNSNVLLKYKSSLINFFKKNLPVIDILNSQKVLKDYWSYLKDNLSELNTGVCALFASEIVGIVLFHQVSKHINLWEIYYVSVLKNFRGHKIATKMFNVVIRKIRDMENKKSSQIYLNIDSDNISGIRFFNKFNFLPIYNFNEYNFTLDSLNKHLHSDINQKVFSPVNQKNYRIYWLLYRQHLPQLTKFMNYNQESFNPEKNYNYSNQDYISLNYLYYKDNTPYYGFISGWASIKNKHGYITEIVSNKIPNIYWKRFLTLLFLELLKKEIISVKIQQITLFPQIENILDNLMQKDIKNSEKVPEKIFLRCKLPPNLKT
ncbi:MAG: GNAT family N-acetyltransferase [Candidatus Hodarchaeales archaeon]|jgi:ribosomal protein S18 acetylase RimI-like enzyme